MGGGRGFEPNPFKRRRTTGREMWHVRKPEAREAAPLQAAQPAPRPLPSPRPAPVRELEGARGRTEAASSAPEPYQFPPLENGGTVEDRRERAATRLYEALRADVPAHIVPGSSEDVADEDLCESLANRIEDHLFEVCDRNVMQREYRNKCRALLTNLRRNARLSLRLRVGELSCAALLSMDNAAMATEAQSAWRASVLAEAKKDLRRPEVPLRTIDHGVHCHEVGACQYVALSMGTSHKDETWGGRDVSGLLALPAMPGEWKEDNS